VTDVELKVAVVDDGKPPTLKVTLPVKPPDPVTVTVYVVLAPRVTGWELGEAEIEKLGPGLTVKVTAVERCSPPPVPVMVRAKVPTFAVLFAVSVMVVDPAPVTELGVNFTLVPEPRPPTLKVTLALNPFRG